MFKLFIIILVLIFLVQGQRPKLTNLSSYAKLKTFDCYFNDFAVENWVFQNYSCELRPYTRSLKSMNVYLAMRKPLHKLFIHGQVYYQYDNLNFRKVLKVPQVEICYYIKFSSENFLLKLILEVLKKHLKALLDECPYEGVIKVENMMVPMNKFVEILPTGNYKIISSLKLLENGPEVGNLSWEFSFKNTLKDQQN